MLVTARVLLLAFAVYVAALFVFQASAWVLGGAPDWGYAATRALWGLWAYLVLYALACVDPDAQLAEAQDDLKESP